MSHCGAACTRLDRPDADPARQSERVSKMVRRGAARGRGVRAPRSLAIGLYFAWFVAPADYQQGETVRIMFLHVPGGMAGVVLLRPDGRLGARHAGLAPPAGRCLAEGGRADRGRLHPDLPRHRRAVGQADVGRLLGLGRAPDLGARAVPDVLRRAGAVARHRGSRPGRARRRDPDARRRGQPADHQVLGRLVEHPAPAGLGVPARRTDDPPVDALAAARDGAAFTRSASRCTSPACARKSCAGACARSRCSRPSASTAQAA